MTLATQIEPEGGMGTPAQTGTATATEPATALAARPRYIADVPQTGEHFAFVASARSARDGQFRFVWTLSPGKTGPGEHIHEEETEVFEIVSGRLRIWLDGVMGDYGPGDVVAVPPRTPHRFHNRGSEPVVVNVSLDGPRMEDLLVPLAVAAHGRKPRLAELLRMAVGMRAQPSTPCRALERWAIGAFTGVLALFGVKAYEPALGWDRDGAAS